MENAVYFLLKSGVSLGYGISSGAALTWQAWDTIDSSLPNSAAELLQEWGSKISPFRMLIESSEPLEDDDCGF